MLLGMTVIFQWCGLTADSIKWEWYSDHNIVIIHKIPYKSTNATLIYRITANDVATEMRIIEVAIKD